jgi:ribosomal protein S18 acetylase RimI-like enzyme
VNVSVRPVGPEDHVWIERFIRERWSDDTVWARDTEWRPAELSGFVAEVDGDVAGLLTFDPESAPGTLEIVTIDAVVEGRGVGRALIEAVVAHTGRSGLRVIRVVTTNDNLRALAFYQRNGFRLAELRPGAVDRTRERKPSIPEVADNGIPIRDELELRMELRPSRGA